jgi:sigma-B regulation protein RsbU (phosphoserine phosphatase)
VNTPPSIITSPLPTGRDGSPDSLADGQRENRDVTLALTDFLDVATLQEMQDNFSSLTRLRTTIRDAAGQPLTLPTDSQRQAQSNLVLGQLITDEDSDNNDDGSFVAPITVQGQQLGSIVIEPIDQDDQPASATRQSLGKMARQLHISEDKIETLLDAAEQDYQANRAAGIQFLYLMANNIARLCYEEFNARQRAEELAVLYRVSTALAAQGDLQRVLDTAAQSVAEVMKVKAVSIRLLSRDDPNLLVPRAVANLSETYLDKGTLLLDQSPLIQEALAGQVAVVDDMVDDPRIVYPQDARREGLVSMLCVGMIFRKKPIGTLQLFTGQRRCFTDFEINLVCTIAQLLATAIQNARLYAQRSESRRLSRQLQLAAEVQRQMLPSDWPQFPPFDLAARYVPSMELAGDFYDFIELEGHLGVAVGDVVGKGLAASLLMASTRASLRAYAQDLYDLDEVISRVNVALSRDTKDNEFATLWYGVFDPGAMRLTYCNAGHEPPMLIRHGELFHLGDGGMIAGVDPQQTYQKGLIDLHTGDLLLLYTDGLSEAMNFDYKQFGRGRIEEALRDADRENMTAADALNHVLWQMRRFAGLQKRNDDTTLVTIKVGEAIPQFSRFPQI